MNRILSCTPYVLVSKVICAPAGQFQDFIWFFVWLHPLHQECMSFTRRRIRLHLNTDGKIQQYQLIEIKEDKYGKNVQVRETILHVLNPSPGIKTHGSEIY